eukprot:3226204-Prymnesium_polylepis.1
MALQFGDGSNRRIALADACYRKSSLGEQTVSPWDSKRRSSVQSSVVRMLSGGGFATAATPRAHRNERDLSQQQKLAMLE